MDKRIKTAVLLLVLLFLSGTSYAQTPNPYKGD